MTVRVSEISRSTLRAVDERTGPDGSQAEFAERLAAAYYDWIHAPDGDDWYDCRSSDGSTKAEVKSARLRVGDEYPADGRFRLWKAQLRSLMAARGGDGTTWVVFVVFDGDRPLALRRMHASTAYRIVSETVGWGPSGHSEWGQQAKLPLDAVFAANVLDV